MGGSVRNNNYKKLAQGRAVKGFTLMELMITVAIVGILASIAYPSYRNSVVKGNRGAAQAYLLDLSQRQQQFLLDNRRYAASEAELSMSAPQKVAQFYTVNIAPVALPPSFTITATPLAGTMQVSDGALSINSQGAKTPADKW